MENLLISLEVMAPLLLWMGLGYLIRHLLKLGDTWSHTTNRVLFNMFLPAMLFRNMVQSDIAQELSLSTLGLLGYTAGAVIVSVIIMTVIVKRIEPVNARRGALIQGIFRSNTALFGIPMALSLYGEGNIAIVTLTVMLVVPLFNVLAVITLETFRSGKVKLVVILKGIFTNPLILSLLLGLFWNLSGLKLPSLIQKTVWGLADVVTPLSFVTLGACFSFRASAKNIRSLMTVVLCKLVLLPAIWVTAGALIGYRYADLLALLVIFAPPTAVSSYPMASAMGSDAVLSSEIVAFTSAFSILSMFLWLFILKTLVLI